MRSPIRFMRLSNRRFCTQAKCSLTQDHILRCRYGWRKWDLDGDDHLSRSTFITIGKKVAALNGVEFTKDFEEKCHNTWTAWGTAPDGSVGEKTTWEEFQPIIISLIENAETTRQACIEANNGIFDWCDVDGNGTMEKKEYTAWQQALGTSVEDAEVGWADLNPENADVITRLRFTTYATDFFFSKDTDHGPCKNFYGKLPTDLDSHPHELTDPNRK